MAHESCIQNEERDWLTEKRWLLVLVCISLEREFVGFD